MKGFLVYSTYDLIEEKTIVKLFGRLENGQSFASVHDLEAYFFIRKSDLKKAQPLLKKFKFQETKLKTFQDQEVIKISSTNLSASIIESFHSASLFDSA